MKAWLNLLKAPVSTKLFSLLSFDGWTFKKSIHNRPRRLLATCAPCVFVDLYNDPLWHGTNDSWWHIWLHLGSLYSNKIFLLLEPMTSPIPDDHSHHVTYEAWLHDISWGVLTGVTLHHWWCKSDVGHPVSILISHTKGSTYVQLFI